MSSPGIDKWVQDAPESWAKLAKGASKKSKFEDFKKKFFEGAENENKGYLKKYLTDEQLKHIYEQGLGGAEKVKIKTISISIKKEKPTVIEVKRAEKTYLRSVGTHWSSNLNFALQKAAEAKLKSEDYYKFKQMIKEATGRTDQAVTKKIQRTRKELKN